MLRHPLFAVLLGLGICVAGTGAGAQQSERELAYEFARNKIGLLRYCRDQGLLGQITAEKAIDTLQRRLARIPVGNGPVRDSGDRAERFGEDGVWELEARQDHATIAENFGTTPAALCKELAALPNAIQQPHVAAQGPDQAVPVSSDLSYLPNIPVAASPPAGQPVLRDAPQPPVAEAPRTAAIIQPARPPSDGPKPWSLFPSLPSPLETNKWKLNPRQRPFGH